MSEFGEQMSTVLQDRDARVEDVTSGAGANMVLSLGRVVKSGRIFSIEHDQTMEHAREFTEWLDDVMGSFSEPSLALQFTEHNIFLNGQLVPLPGQGIEMAAYLRRLLLERGANQLEFRQGLTPGEVLELLEAIENVGGEIETLDGFTRPHISLEDVEEEPDTLQGEEEDERQQIIELYATLLITTRSFFERVRRGGNASSRHIKRIVQRMTDRLDDHSDAFVGLVNLHLLRGRDYIHAAHRAIYSMLLAHEVGLGALDVVRCGMTAVAQDIHNIAREEDAFAEIEVGDDSHFNTNLASITALSHMGTQDVLSALRFVTNYERGFPYNKPLPQAWYSDEMKPHLLSRIVEIARDYDLLTQGLSGEEAMTPDMALHAIMNRMGSYYDPKLTKLFVNVLGVYPVGSMVELSSGERALVVRSCPTSGEGSLSMATRPVVRLLDGSEEMIDLSASSNRGIYINRVLEKDEIDSRPSAMLLF